MDIAALVAFFSSKSFLFFEPVAYAVHFLARVVFGYCKQADFDLSKLGELVEKAGLKIKETVLKTLLEKAAEGVDSLADWLLDHTDDLDVNEGVTEILADQTVEVGQAFDEAISDAEQKEDVAGKTEESLQVYGGAAEKIAESFGKALLNPELRPEIAEKMVQALDSWFEQEMIAREKGLIRGASMRIRGQIPAKQRMVAEKEGQIIDADMSINSN